MSRKNKELLIFLRLFIWVLYLFSGYRLIPSLQEIYSSFGKLRFVKRPLNNLYEDSIMDWFYDNANIVDEAISYGELVDEETHNHSDTDYDWNTENGADLHNIIEAIENEQ